jgi:hypothetical protein
MNFDKHKLVITKKMKIIRQLKLPNNIRNRFNLTFWEEVNELNFYTLFKPEHKTDLYVSLPLISSNRIVFNQLEVELKLHYTKVTAKDNFTIILKESTNSRDLNKIKRIWVDMQIAICDINKWEYQIEGL